MSQAGFLQGKSAAHLVIEKQNLTLQAHIVRPMFCCCPHLQSPPHSVDALLSSSRCAPSSRVHRALPVQTDTDPMLLPDIIESIAKKEAEEKRKKVQSAFHSVY